MRYGVDISSWQTNVNYDQVVKYVSFAIPRVGYGVQYNLKQKDSQFENNYYGLKNKIPLGAYYYQYANEIGEGVKEAENCLKYLDGKELELPVFYDVEDGSVSGLSKSTLTAIVREFVDKIKEAGYKPGIYGSKSWLENKLDMSQFKDCIIWAASYGTNNGKPQDKYKYNGEHHIWQYTSRGSVEGINGYVDMNIMYDELPEVTNEQAPQEVVPVYTGDEVIRNIQKALNERYGYNLDVDGFYGPKTKSALVKALQHELNVQYGKGLAEDGIFGPATKNACVTVRQNAKGNITYLIQAMLYCKGYDTNGVDSIFGKGTTSAVRKFQTNQGIGIDGIVGKDTFEKLFK